MLSVHVIVHCPLPAAQQMFTTHAVITDCSDNGVRWYPCAVRPREADAVGALPGAVHVPGVCGVLDRRRQVTPGLLQHCTRLPVVPLSRLDKPTS